MKSPLDDDAAVPLEVLWTLAERLAARDQWPGDLLQRVGVALLDSDPDGLDVLASDPEWYEAAADALEIVPRNAGERALLAPVVEVARQGQTGARPYTVGDAVADVAGGVAADVEAVAAGAAKAAEVPRELARAAGQAADLAGESPRGVLLVAGAAGLAALLWKVFR